MNLLNVVQHTSADYLGLMEDHLEGRRIRFRYFRPFTEQGSVPGPGDGCDGLVLLGGGPWGSAGGRDVPTLKQEVALTRGTLDQGKDFWYRALEYYLPELFQSIARRLPDPSEED